MDVTGKKKILDVDLSTGKVVKTDIDPEFTRKYMGGMGFSNRILYNEAGPEIGPLSPENIVVFAPGTFSGSQIPGTCRTEITTKHPQTGNIGTGNTGGVWGVHLKRAGYDVLVVRGEAEKPVYLWIDSDGVEVREAGHLWGKDTYETTGILEQETEPAPRVGVIAIGQAGENLVPYACPITDLHHGANRTGAGAVMGAKKLKAIVVQGSGVLRPVRPEEFNKAVAEMNECQEASRKAAMMPGSYSGMGGGLRRYIEEGGLRAKNFTAGILPDFLETRGNREINRKYDSGRKSCYACPAQCFQVSEVKEGKYAGTIIGRGTAIGVICAFGANCAIDNVPAILKSKELCQRFGIDYGGASGTIAYAMELFQRGIIDKSDTDSLDLGWGNEDSVMELIRKIAYREGFGNVLAGGSVKAAEEIGRGAERFVMTTKGVEIIDGDPRAHQKIYVLCHITSPRGGDNIKGGHTAQDSDIYDPNWWIDEFDIFDDIKKKIFKTPPQEIHSTWEGKALYTKWLQDLYSVQNALGTDLFVGGRLGIGPTYLSGIYSAYTGIDTTPEELMESGERIFNLFKAYAVREGQSRKDDTLPDRFFEEPLPDGPAKGAVLSRETINRVLDEYYEVRGWDKKTGAPTRQKLIELGLDDIAEKF